MAKEIIDAEIDETPEEKINETVKEPKKPLRVRVGEWLIADHPKLKKAGRIVAGVGGGLAVAGAAYLAYIHGVGDGDAPLPELPEIDTDEVPFEIADEISEVTEAVTE